MKTAAVLLAGTLAIAACAAEPRPAPEPIVRTIEVAVPIPTPCTPNVGPEPVYVDSAEALAAAPDIFEAMKLRIAGREQRRARATVLAVALAGCAGLTLSEPVQP